MNEKVTIEIKNVKKESIEIINALDTERSLNAYFYLRNILSNENFKTTGSIFKYSEETEDCIPEKMSKKNIIEEYRIYLQSQNKSTSTIKDYKNESIKFKQYLIEGKISFSTVGIGDIESYLSMRNSKKISNSTYIKLINCTRSFLKFLFSREYIKKNLASFIKIPSRVEPIKEVLSDIDIQRIKSYLKIRQEKHRFENLRDSIIFYMGIDCGLRRQELINLNWEDINFEEESMNIVRSKGGKSRVVYFNDRLKGFFLTYRRLTGNYSSALIRGAHGKRLTKCSLQNIVTKMYKGSGIYRKNLTTHSLRHTFAERLRRKGTDIATISKLMGHSSLETTAIYLHSNKEDFKKAML